jgi:hypothetical protein
VAEIVGASLLAMVANGDALNLVPSGALGFFASKLAPTGVVRLPRVFRGLQYATQSRCWEISFEISIIEVLPVNSNFTLPSDEK